ncbi:hypothetical protein N7501_006716 [Penicillium viridicatum]|nr:hypothetical protein N7501_006716 [Penicillium viridicatum]
MVPPISVVPKAQLQMIFHEIQAVPPDGIMLSSHDTMVDPTLSGTTKPNWEQTLSGGQPDLAEPLTASVTCLGIN